MKNKIFPEQYFFNYAFPCAYIILLKGEMTEENYNILEKTFLEKKIPNKEVLEKSFPKAFERIKRLADRMNMEMWDIKVIKEYWKNEHNKIINDGEDMYNDAPENFKDLCRVNEALIVDMKKDRFIVEYNGKKRIVYNLLVPEGKIGDKVKIHYSYAVEIVE